MTDTREVRAVIVGASILLAYVALVLMSGLVSLAQVGALWLAYLGGSFALWLVTGCAILIAQLCWNAWKSRGDPFLAEYIGAVVARRWRRDRGASLLWPPILFATLMASFNAFKQMILPLAGYGLDPFFAEADRMFFLGVDGWRVTHWLFGSPAATLVIDRLYHGWFVPMAIGVILCAWLPAATYKLRTQYLLSYIAVWIVLGSILAFLLPSGGPCFYSQLVGPAPEFDVLLARLGEIQAATGEPLSALRNQAHLLSAHSSDELLVGGGISAMPSVHNALAVLFAVAAWRVSRILGALLAAYAAAIWIGSIHLGWHYGLDGVLAAVLVLIIWRVCGRIADRLERPLVSPSPEPALA